MHSERIEHLSRKTRHFFHVVSNIRPIVWIGLYVALTPLFALVYWALPDSQFHIPDGSSAGYGSWLYYSIVTITTLGFGDYTPTHGWAQAVTAVEVMCGLVFLGFFLNAVGSMKSEIDVESEIEKQKQLHAASETEKLRQSIPAIIHNINIFLSYCYAVTTPRSRRDGGDAEYNADFRLSDMADLFKTSGLPIDHTRQPAVDRLLKAASRTSLCLDSLQTRIDLSIWPALLAECFDFVANYQMFSSADTLSSRVNMLLPEGKSLSVAEAEKRLSDMIASADDKADPQAAGVPEPVVELYN